MFKLPDLPGPWYKKMQDIRHFHQLTQWQFFVLAIKVMCEVGQKSPEVITNLVLSVRDEHPGKYKHVDQGQPAS